MREPHDLGEPYDMREPYDLREVAAGVRARLATFQPRSATLPPGGRRAAVSVMIVARNGKPHVLLLKRAARGRNPGQWALPGGRVDPGESTVSAALRELAEETGVAAGPEDVAGRLDDYVTDSGFLITPFVVVPREPVRPARNPAEVHSIHRIPFTRLLHPDLPRWRRQPDGETLLQMPLRRGMVIHAPTGALLWQFREVALLGRATRVAHVAQPAFTRA